MLFLSNSAQTFFFHLEKQGRTDGATGENASKIGVSLGGKQKEEEPRRRDVGKTP